MFTKIALLDQAMSQLSDDDIAQLEQPEFLLKMPDSFAHSSPDGTNNAFEVPILVKNEKSLYYSRYDKEYTTPKHSSATKAFHQLGEAPCCRHKLYDIFYFKRVIF